MSKSIIDIRNKLDELYGAPVDLTLDDDSKRLMVREIDRTEPIITPNPLAPSVYSFRDKDNKVEQINLDKIREVKHTTIAF